MYATQEQLERRFGSETILQISDRSNVGVIDALNVSEALAQASADIDSYVARQYVLPLAGECVELKAICMTIAYYYLCGERITEDVQNMYDSTMRSLKDIGSGARRLTGVNGASGDTGQPASATKIILTKRNRRIFGCDILGRY